MKLCSLGKYVKVDNWLAYNDTLFIYETKACAAVSDALPTPGVDGVTAIFRF